MWAKEIAAAGTGGTPGRLEVARFPNLHGGTWLGWKQSSSSISPSSSFVSRYHGCGWWSSKAVALPQALLLPAGDDDHGHDDRHHDDHDHGDHKASSLTPLCRPSPACRPPSRSTGRRRPTPALPLSPLLLQKLFHLPPIFWKAPTVSKWMTSHSQEVETRLVLRFMYWTWISYNDNNWTI